MNYTIYDASSGLITKTVMCGQDAVPLQCSTNEDFIAGNFPDNEFYINTSTGLPVSIADNGISQFATSISADGIDVVTFTGINLGSEVSVNGPVVGVVVDGVFEFSTDSVGKFEIEISNFKYKTHTTVIHAI